MDEKFDFSKYLNIQFGAFARPSDEDNFLGKIQEYINSVKTIFQTFTSGRFSDD